MAPLDGYDYERLYQLAVDLNEVVISTGACKSANSLSGGLTRDADEEDTFQALLDCRNFSAVTSDGMRRWLATLEEACRWTPDVPIPFAEVFTTCLRFAHHNPGSGYIVFGEATHTLDLVCDWSQVRITPLTNMTPAYAQNRGYIKNWIKHGNVHRFQCLSRTTTTELTAGFVATRASNITQDWVRGDTVYGVQMRCANDFPDARPTRVTSLVRWSGDVMVGSLQLALWCRDNYFDDADVCWDEIYSRIESSKISSTVYSNRAANAFSRRLLASALADWDNFTVAFPDWFQEFHSLSLREGVSFEGFQRVWGWGWDVQNDVVGDKRWEIVSRAAYVSELLPIGTQHELLHSCVGTGPDGEDRVLFEYLDPGHFRFQV